MALRPDYCTLAELRSFVTNTGTADDAYLPLAITAASRAVEQATDRQFGVLTSAAARYYTPVWSAALARWQAHIDDLMTITSLVVKADTDGNEVYETTITDFRLAPYNAPGDSFPWEVMVFGTTATTSTRPGSLEVTALWGWTAVPSTIKEATLIQASRFYRRRDSPYGVAGSAEMGSEMRLLAKVDPDVQLMLMPYRRWAMV